MYNYTPQSTRHAKFDFDPTTWVVCKWEGKKKDTQTVANWLFAQTTQV